MAKDKKRKPRMSPSLRMRETARFLMGNIEENINKIVYETWLPIDRHNDGHVLREVGMEVQRRGDEVVISVKYLDHLDSVTSSGCVKRGPVEDVKAWLADDANIIDVAKSLEYQYKNVHTWD